MNETPYTTRAVGPRPFRGKRHYFALFQYYKNFQFAIRMRGNVTPPAESRRGQKIGPELKRNYSFKRLRYNKWQQNKFHIVGLIIRSPYLKLMEDFSL